MISQCTKFEVSRFTRYETMNDGAKCRKWGGLWLLGGHSRSWAMSSFDRAHTTFYSTLIETVRLSCTVFEIQPVICRKSPILTYPTCICCRRRGDPGRISRRSLASENQSPWAIVQCCLCDPTFSRFNKHRLVTDGHRAMASTADAQHRAVKNASKSGVFLNFSSSTYRCATTRRTIQYSMRTVLLCLSILRVQSSSVQGCCRELSLQTRMQA